MATKTPKRAPLLADHKRLGKKLVPPLMQLGNLQLTSWVEVGLPESIWMGVLHEKLGHAEGVQLGLTVTKAIDSVARQFVSLTSEFADVQPEHLAAARAQLSDRDRARLDDALLPFVRLYPECPLAPLVTAGTTHDARYIEDFKLFLAEMIQRTSRTATLAQASVLYFALVQGRLQVFKGSSLTHIADIEAYPDTPESRQVASSVRATLNMYFQRQSDATMLWPRYFWNRGFELEPCDFSYAEANGRDGA